MNEVTKFENIEEYLKLFTKGASVVATSRDGDIVIHLSKDLKDEYSVNLEVNEEVSSDDSFQRVPTGQLESLTLKIVKK